MCLVSSLYNTVFDPNLEEKNDGVDSSAERRSVTDIEQE